LSFGLTFIAYRKYYMHFSCKHFPQERHSYKLSVCNWSPFITSSFINIATLTHQTVRTTILLVNCTPFLQYTSHYNLTQEVPYNTNHQSATISLHPILTNLLSRWYKFNTSLQFILNITVIIIPSFLLLSSPPHTFVLY
jgi:hypothetical protein